jgi:hypothetical protein
VAYPFKHANRKFTYAEYESWQGFRCWELIDGVAFDLARVFAD